jgi:sigma-B regulation protein RsbU (phosphoserine phosphatase)
MAEDADGPESYRALYEQAACGLLSTTAAGMIVRVNQTFCAWLGFEPEALIGKKRFQDLLTVGSRIFHQTHWMPLLQVQGSVAEVQLELAKRDGQVVPMLVNAVQRSQAGDARHDIATFVAADRRRYERELLDARKRAEQLLESERVAQQALAAVLQEREQESRQRAVLAEQLMGIVSHDLRTPLNVIVLGASLLTTSGISAAHARTINRISSAGQRANRLISDLLDFTQARLGGGLPVELKPIDLHQLVSECGEELRIAWPGRMIEHRRSGEGLSKADEGRLAQVVINLGGNALTYGEPERAITISSEIDAHELRLRVHNAGRPIPADLLPHIFEPMRRGEQEVQLGSRSVGLGLYIVQQIATAHGGRITVHSAQDEGTTFCLHIPRRA